MEILQDTKKFQDSLIELDSSLRFAKDSNDGSRQKILEKVKNIFNQFSSDLSEWAAMSRAILQEHNSFQLDTWDNIDKYNKAANDVVERTWAKALITVKDRWGWNIVVTQEWLRISKDCADNLRYVALRFSWTLTAQIFNAIIWHKQSEWVKFDGKIMPKHVAWLRKWAKKWIENRRGLTTIAELPNHSRKFVEDAGKAMKDCDAHFNGNGLLITDSSLLSRSTLDQVLEAATNNPTAVVSGSLDPTQESIDPSAVSGDSDSGQTCHQDYAGNPHNIIPVPYFTNDGQDVENAELRLGKNDSALAVPDEVVEIDRISPEDTRHFDGIRGYDEAEEAAETTRTLILEESSRLQLVDSWTSPENNQKDEPAGSTLMQEQDGTRKDGFRDVGEDTTRWQQQENDCCCNIESTNPRELRFEAEYQVMFEMKFYEVATFDSEPCRYQDSHKQVDKGTQVSSIHLSKDQNSGEAGRAEVEKLQKLVGRVKNMNNRHEIQQPKSQIITAELDAEKEKWKVDKFNQELEHQNMIGELNAEKERWRVEMFDLQGKVRKYKDQELEYQEMIRQFDAEKERWRTEKAKLRRSIKAYKDEVVKCQRVVEILDAEKMVWETEKSDLDKRVQNYEDQELERQSMIRNFNAEKKIWEMEKYDLQGSIEHHKIQELDHQRIIVDFNAEKKVWETEKSDLQGSIEHHENQELEHQSMIREFNVKMGMWKTEEFRLHGIIEGYKFKANKYLEEQELLQKEAQRNFQLADAQQRQIESLSQGIQELENRSRFAERQFTECDYKRKQEEMHRHKMNSKNIILEHSLHENAKDLAISIEMVEVLNIAANYVRYEEVPDQRFNRSRATQKSDIQLRDDHAYQAVPLTTYSSSKSLKRKLSSTFRPPITELAYELGTGLSHYRSARTITGSEIKPLVLTSSELREVDDARESPATMNEVVDDGASIAPQYVSEITDAELAYDNTVPGSEKYINAKKQRQQNREMRKTIVNDYNVDMSERSRKKPRLDTSRASETNKPANFSDAEDESNKSHMANSTNGVNINPARDVIEHVMPPSGRASQSTAQSDDSMDVHPGRPRSSDGDRDMIIQKSVSANDGASSNVI